MKPPAGARGFTLFEFTLSMAVLTVLAGVLANRLVYYRVQAERVQVQALVAHLRTALAGRVGALALAGKPERVGSLLGANPVAWLDRVPPNYLGEYYSPDIKKLPRGVWLYDKSDKTLVYVLNNAEIFPVGKPKLLKFKVKFSRLPSNAAEPSGAPSVAEGVVLNQVDVRN